MPTTQVAKLVNRQGNFTDLPLLDPGELGYAKDVKRLFIGNDPIEVTSTGASSYTVPTDLSISPRYRVTTQPSGGTESELNTGFAIGGTTITFSGTAPSVGTTIRIYYNSEIVLNENSANIKETVTLTASATNADTGITWDADNFNCATIEYSLQNAASPTPKFRAGKITIMIDTRAGVQDYMLEDDYVAVNDPAVIFNGNLNNSDNVFKLQYSDSDAVNATLSYDTKLWKTTLA